MIQNSASYKKGKIKDSLNELKEKLNNLVDQNTQVILISKMCMMFVIKN